MNDTTHELALRFIACIASTPIQLKPLVLHCLENAPKPNPPLNGWVALQIENDENGRVYDLKMYVSTAAGSVASEIISAGADGTLHIEVRKVTYKNLSQLRILLFIGNRIVGQMFAAPNGQHLRLAIGELLDAQELDDGVIVVKAEAFEINADTLSYPEFTPACDSNTVH